MAQKVRVININASGGGTTAITASTFARGVEIAEDGSGAGQGFALTFPDGSVGNYKSGEVCVIGNLSGELGGGHQPLVGVPANYNGSNNAATTYASAISLGTATKLRVTERN